MQGTPVMIDGGQRIVHLPNQQPQVIVVNNVKNNIVLLHEYNGDRARKLGIAQIVLATLILAFNIGASLSNYNNVWVISTGFWGSPFIITAGCLGIASSKYKLPSMINATMAFSIIAALLFIPLVTQTALSLATGPWFWNRDNDATGVAMNAIMLLAGIAELPVAIYQTILCCNVTCNCCMEIRAIEAQNRAVNNAGSEQFVYYNNSMVTDQQQFPQDTTPQQQFTLQPMPPPPQYTMQSAPQQHMQPQYIPQTLSSPNPIEALLSPSASGASAGASAGTPRAEAMPLPPAYEDIEHEHSLEMDAKVNEWAARELRLGKSQDMDYTGSYQ